MCSIVNNFIGHFDLFLSSSMCVCVYLHVGVCTGVLYSRGPEEESASPRSRRTIGSCEFPSASPENKTCGLCKSSLCS